MRSDARRFLTAFLQYETGEAGPRVRRALLATATSAFAGELLNAPPRLPHAQLPPARLAQFTITAIPVHPPRALVVGEANRGGHAEQFSFLFDHRRGSWLARGLGE